MAKGTIFLKITRTYTNNNYSEPTRRTYSEYLRNYRFKKNFLKILLVTYSKHYSIQVESGH